MVVTGLQADKIGFDNGAVIGYISMVVAFSFVYFGILSYRNNVSGGRVSYSRALSIGLLIVVISCICYAITWAVVYHTLFPDFIEKYTTYTIAKMKAKGAPASEIDKQLMQMQQYKEVYKNPVMMLLFTFIEPLPVGVPIAFVSAFLVQIRRKTAIADQVFV